MTTGQWDKSFCGKENVGSRKQSGTPLFSKYPELPGLSRKFPYLPKSVNSKPDTRPVFFKRALQAVALKSQP